MSRVFTDEARREDEEGEMTRVGERGSASGLRSSRERMTSETDRV